MRRRLLEAALVVFGQRGIEARVVDDITDVAQVSRGTFYNYFRTNEELLSAVAIEAANEVTSAIEARFDGPPDAAARIAVGVRSWLELVQRYPHIGALFRRAGLYVLDQNLKSRITARKYTPVWAKEGRFTLDRPELLFDIVSGTILAGINTVVTSRAPPGYAEEMAQRILIALGLDADEAASVAFEPLEPLVLPTDSLIERSVALFNRFQAEQ
jgi:AcrR family transcriptional regulator